MTAAVTLAPHQAMVFCDNQFAVAWINGMRVPRCQSKKDITRIVALQILAAAKNLNAEYINTDENPADLPSRSPLLKYHPKIKIPSNSLAMACKYISQQITPKTNSNRTDIYLDQISRLLNKLNSYTKIFINF